MSPTDFLAEVRRRGAVLRLDGERICYRAPDGVMTAKTVPYMQRHKAELIALLAAEAATDPDALALQAAIAIFDAEPDPLPRVAPFNERR